MGQAKVQVDELPPVMAEAWFKPRTQGNQPVCHDVVLETGGDYNVGEIVRLTGSPRGLSHVTVAEG